MEIYSAIFISAILNIFIFLNFEFIAKKINIYDQPDLNRKFHKYPIANIGGIILLINTSYLYLLFLMQIDILEYNFYFKNFTHFFSFFYCLLVLTVIGILDDKMHFSANTKTILFAIILAIALFFDKDLQIVNLKFSFMEDQISLNNFSIFFSILCIFLFMNALNMMDGINLLAGLYCLVILIILSIHTSFSFVIIFIIIGLINYLILNFQNKVFLGDSGSIFLSYIISYFFIKSYNFETSFYADQIFLMMMIPGIDLFRVALYRIITGKNPLKADRKHLHHLLSNKFPDYLVILIILILIIAPIAMDMIINNTLLVIISTLLAYSVLIYRLSDNKVI